MIFKHCTLFSFQGRRGFESFFKAVRAIRNQWTKGIVRVRPQVKGPFGTLAQGESIISDSSLH